MPDDTTDNDSTDELDDGAPPDLGDAGKAALAAERAARGKAQRELKAAQAELARHRDAAMSETERAVETAREEGRREALAASTSRLVAAEIRAAAAGRLADPTDASRFLNVAELTDADGEPNPKAIAKAIDSLVTERPYLAVTPTRTTGSGDGGARGRSTSSNPNTFLVDAIRAKRG